MKYSKLFLLNFAKYVRNNEGDLNELLKDFIIDISIIKDKTPMDLIILRICEYYGVNESHYYSNLKYGNLPLMRKMVVYVLLNVGYKNWEIEEFLGQQQSRISFIKKQAFVLYKTSESFRNDAENILSLIKTKQNEKSN